ncbi:stalk domain-containing protein [Aminipila sp.]|uniref:stalk domain-containing protein n=1 Tax=Aminipila sp. TaxID=2060095 RepID=UPI0028A1BD20|nr:stalk domain-containing protein [Aminipila sp.]
MKRNQRIIGILLSLSLVLGTSNLAYGAVSGKTASSNVLAYVKPEIVVQLNQEMQIFKDVKGQRVYPIVYNGSTYLPVRAISALMNEDIQWDNYGKTVYIGKTFNNPNKSKAKMSTENKGAAQGVDQEDYVQPTWKSAQVTVSVRSDITIMYDFEVQQFRDASENRIYPIVYEGSTYLPVRSISGMMKKQIQWDNVTKTITIGDKQEKQEQEAEPSIYTKRLKAELESAIEIYDQATEKIVNVQKTTDAAMKVMLADSISVDLKIAEKQTIAINNMKKSKMTEEEQAAQEALYNFSKVSENYLLILENIAYLAVAKEDYSMLSDTFVNLALDSQSKMNTARKLIEAL